MMRPRVKNDSWCYTASRRAARRKVRRLSNNRHRQGDEAMIRRMREEGWA